MKPVAKGLANRGALNMGMVKIFIIIGPDDKKTTSVVMQKFEQSSDYQVVINMMEDLHSVDQFRILQRNEFASRDISEESKIYVNDVKPIRTDQERQEAQDEAFLKFQESYIKQCRINDALPLPLLKKLKYNSFVLKNYQINNAVCKSFGSSMHHLGQF
jgi:hypothetical protein